MHITKEIAEKLGSWQTREEIHCEVVRSCKRTIGPKGGEKIEVVRVRPNGKCQTWKTRPEEFRLPIKYGLYGYGAITHLNCEHFHLASDCPINKERFTPPQGFEICRKCGILRLA